MIDLPPTPTSVSLQATLSYLKFGCGSCNVGSFAVRFIFGCDDYASGQLCEGAAAVEPRRRRQDRDPADPRKHSTVGPSIDADRRVSALGLKVFQLRSQDLGLALGIVDDGGTADELNR